MLVSVNIDKEVAAHQRREEVDGTEDRQEDSCVREYDRAAIGILDLKQPKSFADEFASDSDQAGEYCTDISALEYY